MLLSLGSLIPGLSTNAAVLITSLYLDRPPTPDDAFLVNTIAYVCLGIVVLPVLVGGKVYNMLQLVMTAKVFIVLGFCLFIGVFFVSAAGLGRRLQRLPEVRQRAGQNPTAGRRSRRQRVHALVRTRRVAVGRTRQHRGARRLRRIRRRRRAEQFHLQQLCPRQGLGHGQPGRSDRQCRRRHDTSRSSHIGKVFPINDDNLRKWKGWWKYILTRSVVHLDARLLHGNGVARAAVDRVRPQFADVWRTIWSTRNH